MLNFTLWQNPTKNGGKHGDVKNLMEVGILTLHQVTDNEHEFLTPVFQEMNSMYQI